MDKHLSFERDEFVLPVIWFSENYRHGIFIFYMMYLLLGLKRLKSFVSLKFMVATKRSRESWTAILGLAQNPVKQCGPLGSEYLSYVEDSKPGRNACV